MTKQVTIDARSLDNIEVSAEVYIHIDRRGIPDDYDISNIHVKVFINDNWHELSASAAVEISKLLDVDDMLVDEAYKMAYDDRIAMLEMRAEEAMYDGI
jgi:hypothetical protein